MKIKFYLTALMMALFTAPLVANEPVDSDDDISYAPEEAYLSSHPGAFRTPAYISPLGEKIRLDDGSEWTINPSRSDRDKLKDWMTADKLVIVANSRWLSKFDHALRNLSNDDIIEANWITRPLYGGIHHYWIATIDTENHKLRLNDGSVWNMSWFDRELVKRWLEGDTIVVGVNDDWLNSYNPNLLINLETSDHAKGSCKTPGFDPE